MERCSRIVVACAGALALSACVASGPQQRPASAGGDAVPLPPPAAQYKQASPLFGMDAKQLTSRFGTPRLDIHDRSVRKMQFMTAGGKCVLDAYLYVSARGQEPTVTYIETRLTDGQAVAQEACGIR